MSSMQGKLNIKHHRFSGIFSKLFYFCFFLIGFQIAMRGQNAGVGGMIMTNSNMNNMQNVGMAGGTSQFYNSTWYSSSTYYDFIYMEFVIF